MAVNNQERHEQELTIFQCGGEKGLQQMRAWLYARQEKINKTWPEVNGDELLKLQGEAKLVNYQIKMIDQGPTIKETVR